MKISADMCMCIYAPISASFCHRDVHSSRIVRTVTHRSINLPEQRIPYLYLKMIL
ncbi:hypothetical protein M5D96_007855, partial [Drosophila gunungcola]